MSVGRLRFDSISLGKGFTMNLNKFSSLGLAALVLPAVLLSGSATFAAKTSSKPSALVIEGDQKSVGNLNAPQKGTENSVMKTEPSTLNPITGIDLYNQAVQATVMDTLMERDPDTYEWRPALADRAEQSADGKTITFHLRPGATFSDGHPLTAEDVKFSFDVVFDPKYNAAPKRAYFENIEKAEVIDPQTVKFTVKEKYFGNFETLGTMVVVPKHYYGDAEAGKKINKTILGSGPYLLENYDKGQSLVFAKNKKWWGWNVPQNKGRYNFDRIRVRFIQDENIILETLKKGELDIYDDLFPDAYAQKAVGPEWGKTVFKVKTKNLSPKDYMYIGWNLRRDLFKDKNVRKALTMLMNRDEMIKKFRFGMSLPATGPWYQQSEYADPSVKALPFDPKKAVEILNKAGWTDLDHDGILKKMVDGKKVEFRFTLFYPTKEREKYYVLYQNDLKKVGIDMQLQLLEWNALLKTMDEGKFDAVTLRWGGGSVDLDPKQIWHSASAVPGGSNFIGYVNPEADKLIDQARGELDKQKRIPILRKVYKMIAEDYPYVFMFNDEYVLYAHSNKVAMVKPTYKFDVGSDYWWAAP